jgi:hypothetical protein
MLVLGMLFYEHLKSIDADPCLSMQLSQISGFIEGMNSECCELVLPHGNKSKKLIYLNSGDSDMWVLLIGSNGVLGFGEKVLKIVLEGSILGRISKENKRRILAKKSLPSSAKSNLADKPTLSGEFVGIQLGFQHRIKIV